MSDVLTFRPDVATGRTHLHIRRMVLSLVGARIPDNHRVLSAHLSPSAGVVSLICEYVSVTHGERSSRYSSRDLISHVWRRDADTGAYVRCEPVRISDPRFSPVVWERFSAAGVLICDECGCAEVRGHCACDEDEDSASDLAQLRMLADLRRDVARAARA